MAAQPTNDRRDDVAGTQHTDERPRRRRLVDSLVSRRAALVAGAVAAGAVGYGIVQRSTAPVDAPTEGPDASPRATAVEIDRRSVAPDEQILASYSLTIAQLAEAVDRGDGEGRGRFVEPWWRNDTSPFNARVSEQVLSLAWFYANRRTWNPHAGDTTILDAIEAVLDHLLGLQHDDGSWPELRADHHSTAATAFALGYLSRTLAQLGPTDALPSSQHRSRDALSRASRWFLSPALNEEWAGRTLPHSNQAIVGLAGCARALGLHRDPEIERDLAARIRDAADKAQSPAGFLYESGGMDIGYNLNVSLPRIADLHQSLGRAPLAPVVRRLADWLQLAVVPEPDGAGFVTFASASARTRVRYLDAVVDEGHPLTPAATLIPDAPILGAFFTAAEERAALRTAWAESPDPVPAARPSPRVVADTSHPEGLPTREERSRAIGALRPVATDRFTEVRTSGAGQVYLFLRTPQYYLQAHFGPRSSDIVRSGLGTLWHPAGGTFVHASAHPDTDCAWGVVPADATGEAMTRLDAVVPGEHGGADRSLSSVRDAGEGLARLRWTDRDRRIAVEARFEDGVVERDVRAPGEALEQVPLLVSPSDDVRWSDGTRVTDGSSSSTGPGLVVRRGSTRFTVTWTSGRPATLTPVGLSYFRDDLRQVHLLRVPFEAGTTVRYSLAGDIAPGPDGTGEQAE